MHKFMHSLVALLIAIAIAAPAAAQGRGGGPKPHSPKPAAGAATHGSPKITSAKPPQAAKTHGGGGTHAAKTTTHAKPSKAPSGTTSTPTTKATKATKATTTTPSTPTTTTVTLTPVQQKLQRNTNLASKLESRLPKGTNLMLAAEGFRNLGQFVAAVNVSNNLGIPFRQLKASMVDDGLSLGQSIQKLRPLADASREAARGETQAKVLLDTPTTTTTTSSTTTTSTKTKKNSGASPN
jgi:hypothetical protein